MKFATFLILFGFCLATAISASIPSDTDSDGDSRPPDNPESESWSNKDDDIDTDKYTDIDIEDPNMPQYTDIDIEDPNMPQYTDIDIEDPNMYETPPDIPEYGDRYDYIYQSRPLIPETKSDNSSSSDDKDDDTESVASSVDSRETDWWPEDPEPTENELRREHVELLDRVRQRLRNNEHGSSQATQRLTKELSDTLKSDSCAQGVFDVKLANETNIYEWFVYLRVVDPKSELYQSLQKYKETSGQDAIILNIEFPNDYPFSPPFVRVVSPVIYGGHVQAGGAICNQLLSPYDWSPAASVESVIATISVAMTEDHGRVPPQPKDRAEKEYNKALAKEQFDALVEGHKDIWAKKPSN